MGLGLLVRRWASDRTTALAVVATIAFSLIALAAGPVFEAAVSQAALRSGVADGERSDLSVEIEVTNLVGPHDVSDAEVRALAAAAMVSLPVDVSRYRQIRTTFGLPDPTGDRVDLARIGELEGMASAVTVLRGAAMTGDADADTDADTNVGNLQAVGSSGPIDVWVHDEAAQLLGLAPGDLLALAARSGPERVLDVVVAGTYLPNDGDDLYWTGRDQVAQGTTESASFRTAAFMTGADAFDALVGRSQAQWLLEPELREVDPAEIESIVLNVERLPGSLARIFTAADADAAPEVDVTTTLGSHLDENNSSLSVARSTMLAVTASLAIVVAVAITLVSALVVESRRKEAELWEERGVSAVHVLRRSVGEALLVTVPAAVVAIVVAPWIVGVLGSVGPLASVSLDLGPSMTSVAVVVVTVASCVIVVLSVVPAWRRHRRAEASGSARAELASGWQTAGVDLAALALAVLAWWRVTNLGDERTASLRGSLGIDPLVIAAPVLGLLASALVAGRVLPVIARVADRLATASAGLVVAVAAWEMARRPTRHRQVIVFLVAASAFTVYSSAFDATWTRSQAEQAEVRAGGDITFDPDRRTGVALPTLVETAVHETIDGVATSLPVHRRRIGLGASDDAQLVALDAMSYVAPDGNLRVPGTPRADGSSSVASAVAALADRRPALAAVALPEGTIGLSLPWRVAVEPTDDPELDDGTDADVSPLPEPPPPDPLIFSVSFTVRDDRGLLHRIEAGQILVDDPVVVTFGTLDLRFSGDQFMAPAGAMSIVDIELATVATPVPSNRVELTIGPVSALDEQRGEVVVGLSRDDWFAEAAALGRVNRRPGMQILTDQGGALALDIVRGSSAGSGVPIRLTLRGAATDGDGSIAAVVTDAWLDAAGREVGDVVSMRLASGASTALEIVGAVSHLPGSDPSLDAAVLIDLPTLQVADRAAGRRLSVASEHWLALAEGVDPGEVRRALLDAPVAAVDVRTLDEERSELLTDPPALAAIAGLSVGSVAGVALAAIGVITAATISTRDRRRELAVLSSMGMTARELRRSLALEQLGAVVVGVALGTGAGALLAYTVIPSISLGRDGAVVLPEVVVTIPWGSVAIVLGSAVALLAAALIVISRSVMGLEPAVQIREGIE